MAVGLVALQLQPQRTEHRIGVSWMLRPASVEHKEATMLVRALMTGDPITVPPDTPVLEARQIMTNRRIRHVLVARDTELLGIVTDRDVRLNMPSQATSLSVWELNYLLTKLTVGEVMTRAVIVIGPDRDARDAAEVMLEHKIGALPVVDHGALIGILTETDVLRAFIRRSDEAAVLRGR